MPQSRQAHIPSEVPSGFRKLWETRMLECSVSKASLYYYQSASCLRYTFDKKGLKIRNKSKRTRRTLAIWDFRAKEFYNDLLNYEYMGKKIMCLDSRPRSLLATQKDHIVFENVWYFHILPQRHFHIHIYDFLVHNGKEMGPAWMSIKDE